MNRKILLVEPNYKNKYPPMGLKKLATYFRQRGDDVRFFKGNLKMFAAQLLCEGFLEQVKEPALGKYISFPQFDIVGVTPLFTFFWRETIETINFSKKFCSKTGRVIVGGIAASILHERILQETGINPICGLLNKPGLIDANSTDIIDELPLDYSILEEVEYVYPAKDAYFAYMTRGCPRKCSFCAVPRLEPEYKNYFGLKEQIDKATKRFGPKKNLLLMDNNVFASEYFDKIVDEIKECGFGRDATFTPESEYDIAIRNLRDGFNTRAYTKKIVRLYDRISNKLPELEQADFYLRREEKNLLYAEVAKPEALIEFDETARPLYNKYFRRSRNIRTIDFNQGVDARLVTDRKMKKLAEINIRPLRIAFDSYSMKETYETAVRTAAKYGITDLSNYLLYNFEDSPDELYYRIKVSIELSEELGVTIYSFPMKYHPIDDPEDFDNREYIGENWNRKFIRSIHAVLNSTKGKIGCGKAFFEEAFGKDITDFHKILWMPETFIIERFKYKNNLTAEWWNKYNNLNATQREKLHSIVATNVFDEKSLKTDDPNVNEVLKYYQVKRVPK